MSSYMNANSRRLKRQRFYETATGDGLQGTMEAGKEKAEGAAKYLEDFVNFFVKLLGQEKHVVDLTSKGKDMETKDYAITGLVLGILGYASYRGYRHFRPKAGAAAPAS